MGPLEGALLQMADRNRAPIPDKIANAPVLLTGLDLYWNAFRSLSTCRQAIYNTEGPIPWNILQEYCDRIGIEDEDDREYFIELIGQMDITYLNFKTKKMAAPR